MVGRLSSPAGRREQRDLCVGVCICVCYVCVCLCECMYVCACVTWCLRLKAAVYEGFSFCSSFSLTKLAINWKQPCIAASFPFTLSPANTLVYPRFNINTTLAFSRGGDRRGEGRRWVHLELLNSFYHIMPFNKLTKSIECELFFF